MRYKYYFMFLFLSRFTSPLVAQKDTLPMRYHPIVEATQSDLLMSVYGRHKKLPVGYELQALLALSHYPELSQKQIAFILKPADLPYSSHPTLFTLLCPFVKKRYKIMISTATSELRTPTILKNLAFEAQIGALGHELAHTTYYSSKSKWAVLRDGLHYSNLAFKERFEKMTDRIAIDHGLGPELYAWSKATYPTKLKDGNRAQIYYAPEEILKIWGQQ